MMIGGRVAMGLGGSLLALGIVVTAFSRGGIFEDEPSREGLATGLTLVGLGVAGVVAGGVSMGLGYRETQAARRGELSLWGDPSARTAGLSWRRRF